MNRTQRCIHWVAALVLLSAILWTQPLPAGDDWQPISPEDLALKDNPASPGTNAMILYREYKINAPNGTEDEYIRIKTFTKEGADQNGNVSLLFGPTGHVENVRARTIHPDGTIVNFNGEVFDKTITRANGTKYVAKSFALPDVQPGSITEYRFRRQFDTKYYWSMEWTIQGDYFTRLGRFSIVPSTSARAPQLLFRSYGLPQGSKPERQPNGEIVLEVRDLPGVEKEDLMPPDRVLRARVSFFYRDMSAGYNETTEAFWKRIGKQRSDALDTFVNKRSQLEGEVARVTSPGDSPEVKLKKLAARVREIRDLSYERSKSKEEKREENIKPNANVEDVLKHGYASGREINYLFVGLARAAGFNATDVYLAPRSESEFVPQIQDEHQLTADVVWVNTGEKEMFLDPASKFQPFGKLPWEETASQGIKVSKNGSEFVTTPMPESADATITRKADVELSEDGAAAGKIQVEFAGYRAASWRKDLRDDDEAGRRKRFESVIRGWLPDGATTEVTSISDWDKVEEPLRVTGTFKIPTYAGAIGHRMLVPETVFRAPYAKTFVPAKRVNLVYFHFPFENTDQLTFHAPKGFQIETTPVSRKFDQEAVFYEITSTNTRETVQVTRKLVVKNIVFPAEQYAALRAFFSGVKANDEAQIVLQNPETAKNQ
jgi:hypothetical protein